MSGLFLTRSNDRVFEPYSNASLLILSEKFSDDPDCGFLGLLPVPASAGKLESIVFRPHFSSGKEKNPLLFNSFDIAILHV